MASRYTRRKKDCARNMSVLARQDLGMGESLSLAGPDRRVVRLVAHEARTWVSCERCPAFVLET